MLKIPNGGWFPLVVAGVLTSLQYIWNWGQRLKSVSQGEQHVPVDAFFAEGENELRLLWSDTPIPRVPGVAFIFSTATPGLPPVLQHFVRNVPALHDVIVLISVRHVPVTTVLPTERILVAPIEGFTGLYRAVVRFGYNDLTDLGDGFAQEINASIYRICEADDESRVDSLTDKGSEEGSLSHYIDSEAEGGHGSVRGGVTFDAGTFPSRAKQHATSFPHHLGRHSLSSALVRGSVLASIQQSEDQEDSQRKSSVLYRRSQPATAFSGRDVTPAQDINHSSRSPLLVRNSMPVGRRSLAAISYTGSASLAAEQEHHRRHPWPQIQQEAPSEVVIDASSREGDVSGSGRSRRHAFSNEWQPIGQEPALGDGKTESIDAEQHLRIQHVRKQGAVYIVGRSNVRCRKNARLLRRLLLDKVYATVHNNFQEWASSMNVPQERLMEVGMPVEL